MSIKTMGCVLVMAGILLPALNVQATISPDLSRTETVRHLENIQRAIRYSLQDTFASGRPNELNKTAAIAAVSRSINSEAVTYWMTDVPVQIVKGVVWRTAYLANALVSSNVIAVLIGSMEQLAVHQSKQIITEWMKEHSMRAASGNLRSFYEDYRKELHRPEIQYTLVYHPQDKKSGRVIAEFRSPHPISPPTVTSRAVWDAFAWKQSGQKEIPAFILEINGSVQERNGLFSWTKTPTISVSFPAHVPDIIMPPRAGIWQKLFGGITKWGRERIDNLAARLTPTSDDSEKKQIEELKISVQELRKVVENEQPAQTDLSLDKNLSNLIEELSTVARSLSGLSEENRIISQEVAQVVKYSTEIMRWQNENQESKPVANSPEIKEPETSKDTKLSELPLIAENSPICQTDSLPRPTHRPVILNEIAWMGRTTSANHEWIELRNLSDKRVPLVGWQLFNRNQNLMIVFDEKDFVAPQGYFLLVRTAAENVSEATSDRIYSGAIKNRDEAFYLFNPECTLIDLVQANPDWTSGDNITKKTMERKDDLDWQTSLLPHGTPRRKNSSGYQGNSPIVQQSLTIRVPVQTDIQPPIANAGPDQTVNHNEAIILNASLSGDNLGITAYRWDTNSDGLYNHVLNNHILEISAGYFLPGQHIVRLQVSDAAGNNAEDVLTITVREVPKIFINEIQFHGATNHDEFIELYNPHSEDIDLARWSIRKKTSGGSESTLVSSSAFKGIIEAYGYFLVANPRKKEDGTPHYQGAVEPDLYYSGQTYHFAANNTILLYTPNRILIDKVGYGTAQDYLVNPFPENPPAGMSLGRRWDAEKEGYLQTANNAHDFEHQVPTPGRRNQSSEEELLDESLGPEEVPQDNQDESSEPEEVPQDDPDEPLEPEEVPQDDPDEPLEPEEVFQDGSSAFPFLISSCQDLLIMEENLGAFYELTGDIDCQETEEWNDGEGFRPIGLVDNVPFIGQLDGKNFSIIGIHQEQEDGKSGLFNSLGYPAKIINLNLKQSYAVAEGYHSGLLAEIAIGQSAQKAIIIDRVSVQGELITSHVLTNAPQYAGGMIGRIDWIYVTNSQSNVLITAHQLGRNDSTVGGMFGYVSSATIRYCSSRGQISGQSNIGGLIGKSGHNAVIQENYSMVHITGESYLGGFIGVTEGISGTISDNYATGNVTGSSEIGRIGGFVGESMQWIDRSYSIGRVQGAGANGFIGARPSHRTNPVRDSYYDVNTSGRSGNNFGAIGRTTQSMQTASNFAGWDFERIWQINNGYPFLRQNP